MGPIADFVLDGSIIAIVTGMVTWFSLSKRMERKYQSVIEARAFEVAQKTAHKIIDQQMGVIWNRFLIGNILIMRLCEKAGITMEEIDKLHHMANLQWPAPQQDGHSKKEINE